MVFFAPLKIYLESTHRKNTDFDIYIGKVSISRSHIDYASKLAPRDWE